eukprot:3940610-Rhodomonas_salina.3
MPRRPILRQAMVRAGVQPPPRPLSPRLCAPDLLLLRVQVTLAGAAGPWSHPHVSVRPWICLSLASSGWSLK